VEQQHCVSPTAGSFVSLIQMCVSSGILPSVPQRNTGVFVPQALRFHGAGLLELHPISPLT